MLDGLRATAAGVLRRAAELLGGDNTGVISAHDPVDRALDEAADSASVPAQDPVTPEALALLRARGPADTIPDSPCAHGFFEAERVAPHDAKKSPIPVFRRRFLP